MSILVSFSLRCFSIFQRSMIQANELPLCEVLDSSLFAKAFEEDEVVFGIDDENVFTPAITLWAMISQFLFKQEGRSCKAAAGRIIMVDGFTIDAPDTAENQAKYPQNPAQAEGLGFPILRCVCLISMITGMLMDLGYAAYSGKETGSHRLPPEPFECCIDDA